MSDKKNLEDKIAETAEKAFEGIKRGKCNEKKM